MGCDIALKVVATEEHLIQKQGKLHVKLTQHVIKNLCKPVFPKMSQIGSLFLLIVLRYLYFQLILMAAE